jgi:NitT/TauT family transport system permease protein
MNSRTHAAHRRARVYQSRRHLAITLLFLLIPFAILLVLSSILHLPTAQFFSAIPASLARMLVAYIIALVLGWGCAVAFFRGKRALVALPIFDVLQSFPTFAALPLVVSMYGSTNAVVIFFLVLAIIWPIFFATVSSLKLVKKDWDEAVAIAHLKGWRYLRHYLLPVSIPGAITGSVIGLGDGWEALIATEIIVQVHSGAGTFFQQFSADPQVITFGILGFLAIIFSINKLVWLPLLDWSHKRMEE